MKIQILALALGTTLAFSSCNSGADQIATLETQLTEQKQALVDTVAYFTTAMSDMQFQMDSINAELAKFTAVVASPGTSTKKPAAPAKPTGEIDVTKKGGGDAPKIDVTKKGGGDAPKIDVTKKGGGN
ncbi:MAG: hypothetical protein GC205_09010 [Bacteroidetes bacterium]|nr:hypothetical protein [Bacteroidota bacterium]